jgi:hypothetical protein
MAIALTGKLDVAGKLIKKVRLYSAFSEHVFSSPDPKGQVSYCHHLASDEMGNQIYFKIAG